jgi:RimJ/RimL family protein N-acetyltransferase
MHHALNEEGFGIRIRPVRMDDAAFIVWLRHQEHARGRLGDSATDVAGQERWLSAYFERAGDYYFIAETLNGLPVGTTSIYGLSGDTAETGRFVTCPDVPAAFPISILTYDLAFERLKLKELRATSVASNRTVHSYVRKLGFRQVRVETAGQVIGGQPVDMLHFVLEVAVWLRRRVSLLPLAQYATEQILEWEKQSFARGTAFTCATS